MDGTFEGMTVEQLRAELKKLKDCLCDIEDIHSFTFHKTSTHISATRADEMQQEFEQECREFREKIAEVERLLREKGAL